ncbi:MAG: recombinase family protein [Burkholderiales bacterium]|nr:recombinase family protein [Burkholderiales bacterium]
MVTKRQRRQVLIEGKLAAAEYIRMSTEMQDYSGINQQAAIRDYAERHGYSVVRTYADEGKSGLHLRGRDSLQRLLRDVEAGDFPFSAVLIYDISRWGRFQDADESAFYEFLCRRAGLKVIYCAEPFVEDGSTVSAIFKSIKRAMAGEYSRELSEKIFTGQRKMTERGFRQGGPPGLGLRRMLVDRDGEPQGLMAKGQHKSFKSDRTILVPGPADEVELVQRIFSLCADDRLGPQAITDLLNAEAVPRDRGLPWSRAMIRGMLVNEKYVGVNLYNRISSRLGKRRTESPPELQFRKADAFEPLVSRQLFERTQAALVDLARSPPDELLLDNLRALLRQHGYLSGRLIDSLGRFTAAGYSHRFGSLFNAYTMIGYWPEHVQEEARILAGMERVRIDLATRIHADLASVGLDGRWNSYTSVLALPDGRLLSLQIHRSIKTRQGLPAWNLWVGDRASSDFMLFIRMDPNNEAALDLQLVPRILLPPGRYRVVGLSPPFLKAYRFSDVSMLTSRLEDLAHLGP